MDTLRLYTEGFVPAPAKSTKLEVKKYVQSKEARFLHFTAFELLGSLIDFPQNCNLLQPAICSLLQRNFERFAGARHQNRKNCQF